MFRAIKMLDVELNDGVRDVDGLDGYGAVQALVRLHGVPMGYASVPVQDGRCHAEDLRRAVANVAGVPPALTGSRAPWRSSTSQVPGGVDEAAPSRPASVNAARPMVTVAVCTRNRPANLAVCLNSVVALRYPRLDLLVVDNASDSRASEGVARSYPTVRYVREPRVGLDWARNRAIAEADGEIIAYTDDDVVVDPLWVDALARVFCQQTDVMAVTGLVVPYELETEAQVLFERRGGFGRGFQRRSYRRGAEGVSPAFHLEAWRFGTGANMAFRRRLFEQIGGFDPALDVGTVTNGGGDLEMFFRVLEEGHTLVYEPAALVRHRHRREYSALRSQMKDNGIGRSAFLLRSAVAYPARRSVIIRFWMRLTRARLLGILRSLVVPRSAARDLLVADLAGAVVGLARYWRARRIAADIERLFGPIRGVDPRVRDRIPGTTAR